MNFHGWCPIISSRLPDGESLSKCEQGKCAWWDEDKETCVVFSILDAVKENTYEIKRELRDIYSNIPSI